MGWGGAGSDAPVLMQGGAGQLSARPPALSSELHTSCALPPPPRSLEVDSHRRSSPPAQLAALREDAAGMRAQLAELERSRGVAGQRVAALEARLEAAREAALRHEAVAAYEQRHHALLKKDLAQLAERRDALEHRQAELLAQLKERPGGLRLRCASACYSCTARQGLG